MGLLTLPSRPHKMNRTADHPTGPDGPRRNRQRALQELLPQPSGPGERDSAAWLELQRSFRFFQRGARRNRCLYFVLRVTVLIAGASVPIVSLSLAGRSSVALLGALIVVAEGATQLTQVHGHWLRYRRTAESLRREAISFATHSCSYEHAHPSRERLLATRIVTIIGRENHEWEETVRAIAREADRSLGPT